MRLHDRRRRLGSCMFEKQLLKCGSLITSKDCHTSFVVNSSRNTSVGTSPLHRLTASFPGNDGDDYLVLGLRGGRAVHRFNLGSGVATLVSDRLDPRVSIHSVAFGRSGKTGWLKVMRLLVWTRWSVVFDPRREKTTFLNCSFQTLARTNRVKSLLFLGTGF